jgi:hypothetical protein
VTPPGGSLVDRVAAACRVARAALLTGTAEGPPIVRRFDGQSAVAFLAALTNEGDCDAVVPLAAGRNIVCRGGTVSDHDWSPYAQPLVEGGQWTLRCHEDRSAEVADAWSTNGGVVLAAAALSRFAAVPRVIDLLDHTLGVTLVHPAYHANTLAYHPIIEGELLIGIYRAFVFGWV